jgi:hypothetical protein
VRLKTSALGKDWRSEVPVGFGMATKDQAPADLSSTVWRDDTFFQQFPLNVHTVLDYFSRSPFYVPGCNNEECKRRCLPIDALPCVAASCSENPQHRAAAFEHRNPRQEIK